MQQTNPAAGCKKPPKHQVTWWWNGEVDDAIKEKRRLWKAWKSGGSKTEYNNAKRISKKKVYEAKKRVEEECFANVNQSKDARNELFQLAQCMIKTNSDVTGDKCVKNDEGNLACTDEGKLAAWKQHYQKLLNEEFPWDEEHLVFENPCEGPPPRIDRTWVIKALRRMKDKKAAGSTGITAEMLKAARDIGIDILSDICNDIISEKEIPAKWDSSIILNCFKGKGAAV